MAKAPVAGQVKTRLCPPLAPHEAAGLARAAIADTLAAVAATVPLAARFDCEVEPVLVLSGRPQGWLPQLLDDGADRSLRIRVTTQRGDGLDSRLAAAFEDVGANTPAFLIGMDTPQVTPGLLAASIATLLAPGRGAVLGHAVDGGWWGLGLKRPDPALLQGVPMSTSHTGRDQQSRLAEAGLSVSLLPELVDVDTIEDAEHVAGLAPESHFARALRDIRQLVTSR